MSPHAVAARSTVTFFLAGLDNAVDRMGDSLRGAPLRWNTSAVVTFVLCLAAVVLAAWLLVRLAGYQDWRVRCNSPPRLFLVLCRAHRLRWKDRWLLWRLAEQRGLADPARLFLDPSLLDGHDLPAGLARCAGRLDSLRKRLFAGLTPAGSGAPDAPRRGRPDASSSDRPPLPAAADTPVGFPRESPQLDVPPWLGSLPVDHPAGGSPSNVHR
jgi:hypothetical protein